MFLSWLDVIEYKYRTPTSMKYSRDFSVVIMAFRLGTKNRIIAFLSNKTQKITNKIFYSFSENGSPVFTFFFLRTSFMSQKKPFSASK